jgi:hypothetical protein
MDTGYTNYIESRRDVLSFVVKTWHNPGGKGPIQPWARRLDLMKAAITHIVDTNVPWALWRVECIIVEKMNIANNCCITSQWCYIHITDECTRSARVDGRGRRRGHRDRLLTT